MIDKNTNAQHFQTTVGYTIAIKSSIFPLITPLRFLETVRTETFERYQKLIVVDKKKQNTSNLIKKIHGISDLLIDCKHLTKITHKFYKIQ